MKRRVAMLTACALAPAVAIGGGAQAQQQGAWELIDINESGIVVGYRRSGTHDGVFWIYGAVVEMHNLVNPTDTSRLWLQNPEALNDRLWVVGTRSGTSNDASWLLRPPQPPRSG